MSVVSTELGWLGSVFAGPEVESTDGPVVGPAATESAAESAVRSASGSAAGPVDGSAAESAGSCPRQPTW